MNNPNQTNNQTWNYTKAVWTSYHQSVGDLSGDHSEREDVQRWVCLKHLVDRLLRDDEGGQNDNGERDDRRYDACSLYLIDGHQTSTTSQMVQKQMSKPKWAALVNPIQLNIQ